MSEMEADMDDLIHSLPPQDLFSPRESGFPKNKNSELLDDIEKTLLEAEELLDDLNISSI